MCSELLKLAGSNVQLAHLAATLIGIGLVTTLLCFVVSEITFNYSQVDKLWSFMPVAYSLIALITFPSPRLWIMFILVTIWGFRLSYNFYRKGGYNIIPWKGDEDYRWRILRESPALKGRIRFGLFNLFFISLYQNFVILMFCSPLFLAAADRDTSLRLPDIIAATMMLLFIIAESTADNQLFRFQTMKRQGASSEGKYAESLKNGFICEGLWRYVRHPNYTSEQAVWVCFYIFGAAASGRWLNWTIIGPLLLVLLFQGSSTMTENISMGKYPDYAGYRKKVPGFLPRLF